MPAMLMLSRCPRLESDAALHEYTCKRHVVSMQRWEDHACNDLPVLVQMHDLLFLWQFRNQDSEPEQAKICYMALHLKR